MRRKREPWTRIKYWGFGPAFGDSPSGSAPLRVAIKFRISKKIVFVLKDS